jgi:L-ascorbate 6-phosphate lactonase
VSRRSLRHLGQSGFRLCCGETVVYIDPYLSDHVELSEGPSMRRMRMSPMSPAAVRDADWVLLSHIHADHCDPLTIDPIARNNPGCRFLGPYEVADYLVSSLKIAPERILTADDRWIPLSNELKVRAIPAAHTSIERNDRGQSRYVGFLLDTGDKRVYHSGDCSVHSEVVSLLKEIGGSIDIALLPVNECNYYRTRKGIVGNMSIREAFGMAGEINATNVVPMHFDMFQPNSVCEEEILAVYRHEKPAFQLVMPDSLSGF